MGRETMTAYFGHLHDYAERLARAEIRDIPDGTYRFTDISTDSGKSRCRSSSKAKVIVAATRHDRLDRIDRAGEGRHQFAAAVHQGLRLHAMRSIMSADVPNCFGYTRAIKVVAPAARWSIRRCRFPAGAAASPVIA
jgi:N-methylhydantoinase B